MIQWFKGFKSKTQPIITVGDTISGPGELNPGSPTWAFIHTLASEELEKARIKNDNPALDLAATQYLRGRIHQLKGLLALPAEKRNAEIKFRPDDYNENTDAGYS